MCYLQIFRFYDILYVLPKRVSSAVIWIRKSRISVYAYLITASDTRQHENSQMRDKGEQKMYEIFMQLCQRNNVAPNYVGRQLGIASSSLSDWKSGRSELKTDKLKKIADYFGVTLDYLVTGKETEHEPYYKDEESRELADFLFQNPQYKTLFSAVRDIPPEDLKMVQDLLERLKPKGNNYGA